MNNQSFGRQLLATSSASQWIKLEEELGLNSRFEIFDEWLISSFQRFFNRQRLAIFTSPRGALASLKLEGISESTRVWLDCEFALKNQQSRGALYHPVKEKSNVGWCNLGWYFSTISHFAVGAASEEAGSPLLQEAEAIALWGVLTPFFDVVAIPFRLRGPLLGQIEREEADILWSSFVSLCADLGWDLGETIAPFRPGAAWVALDVAQQQKAKIDLMIAIGKQSSAQSARLFRARQLRELTTRFYDKCKKETLPRKKVLHKPAERLLCGFFGGDWSAALDYWGETPHAQEEIAGPLPQVRLLVGTEGRVADVAAQTGLPEAEVRLMVESFWDSNEQSSPVEQRVGCLRDYWQEFGAIHDQQVAGMKSLWGLVSEGGADLPVQWRASDDEETESEQPTIPIRPGLFKEMFSQDLNEKIESLWGKALLPRYPERMVTSLNPHAFLSSVYGDALKFWNGVSLTAWFLCEGPYSRTDLPGLEEYYRRQLANLQSLGTPIDGRLFSDLLKGGEKLGPETPIIVKETEGMTISHGSRRDGFEILRGIIKTHRERWTDENLDSYLKSRWESELREAGGEYTHKLHAAGKALAPKVVTKLASKPTNHWFGGDVSAFCRTIGAKSPVEPFYERLMPIDRRAFAVGVRDRLAKYESLYYCGAEAMIYIQIWEAIGRKPEPKEFALGRNAHIVKLLNEDDQLWKIFVSAIELELGKN